MDVKQMLYMVTIAQEGGISKAAKLFITQSALDQQLLKLEHELGTPLFYRSRSSFSILARRSISRPSGANGSSSGLMSALRVTQNTTFSSVLYISNTLSA